MNNIFRVDRILWAGRVFQFGRDFESSFELSARFRLLSLLVKSESEVVVRFRIARFQANRFSKFRLCFWKFRSLQEHQAQVVVSFRENRIAPQEFTKHVRRAAEIAFLAENQAKLHACVHVFGIQSDRLIQLLRTFIQFAYLRQRQPQIVVRFRKVRIGRDGLPEFG